MIHFTFQSHQHSLKSAATPKHICLRIHLNEGISFHRQAPEIVFICHFQTKSLSFSSQTFQHDDPDFEGTEAVRTTQGRR